jgi:RNA polymerase sigma-70 factor (ECF subfamily)
MTVDDKIIEGCISGKQHAQRQLYQRFAPGMLGLCLRYTKNLAEAEDVLQEGFIKVFRSIKELRNTAALEGWIKRIMVNTAISYYHSKKIRFVEVQEHHLDILSDEVESESYLPVDPEIVLSLIQEMPEGYRMVLNLFVFEGYSHKEISAMLKISDNTSKSQLSKARNYLRLKLEKMNHLKIMQNEGKL